MSLLVVVFAVELAIYLVNLVGAESLNNMLWSLITLLRLGNTHNASQQRQLQREYLDVRKELNATSSQDEFAKWARLRRSHDKLLEQLEKNKQSMDAARSRFDSYLTLTRLLVTKLPHFVLPIWYSKVPIFWLPHGLYPYYAEWLLALPRAPLGSVSLVTWQAACVIVIRMAAEILLFFWNSIPPRPVPGATPPPAESSRKGKKAKKAA